MRRLEAAPRAHAEALLVAYDLLQEAHDQGILDALHGMVHAKDELIGKVAEGARVQESIDALRNLISAGKMLGAVEPETLSCIAAAVTKPAAKPLGLWGLFRKATSLEGRRGLTMMVEMLVALGTRRGVDRG